jgi:hypothetical protein
MATFTVYVKSRGESVTFESTLSNEKVLEILRGMRSSFAQDLARKFSNLSEAQYAWAHKLAVDNCTPKNVENSPEMEALFQPFRAAVARGMKRMKMRFEGIALSPNRDLSALWVTSLTETEDGAYGPKPKYLGKVTLSGPDSRLSDNVKAAIFEVAKDPLTAAIRHGKETGECSCCGRELTNQESIRLGIGPICREKFGL